MIEGLPTVEKTLEMSTSAQIEVVRAALERLSRANELTESGAVLGFRDEASMAESKALADFLTELLDEMT